MMTTIATGFCAGIAAGVTRDLAKWYLKNRVGRQKPVNYIIVNNTEEFSSLFNEKDWKSIVNNHVDR